MLKFVFVLLLPSVIDSFHNIDFQPLQTNIKSSAITPPSITISSKNTEINVSSVATTEGSVNGADPTFSESENSSWRTLNTIKRLNEKLVGKARDLCNQYSDQMDKRPVFTQCVTASIFSLLSGILSQTIEARTIGITLSLDMIRLSSFTLAGFVFDGPFCYFWYDLMWKFDDYLQTSKGFSKISGTSAQVFVDQTIGSLIYFPLYFYVYDIIEAFISGKLPCLITTGHKVRTELFAVIFVSYLVFPLSNFLNFFFIPKHFRIMFMNVVNLFFSAYQCSKVR